MKPLSEIDLKHPEQVETYDELSPFLQRIAAQNREIDARMAEIRKQQQEFSMITENMSEGLFVVDRNYQILSYNKSAMQIFGMDPRQEHENLLAVNRSEGFRNAVDSALKGRHTQENLELNGRVYQIIANAVCQPDFAEDMVGAVILVLDWKHYEYFFIIAFAAAALLFLARGIRTIGEDKSHLAGGILYLIGATFMVSFLTASILTILGGSL